MGGLEIASVDDNLVKIRDSTQASAEEKVGILETYRNKPWFELECSELANKRKQLKLLWQQNPKEKTAEDFTNVKCNTRRTVKKKKCD